MADTKEKLSASSALSFAAGLQSLATSATVGQVSAKVDNTANLYEDVQIQAVLKGTNAGSPTGFVDLYVITSQDGTVFTGDVSGYTGSNGSYTLGAAGSPNLIHLGSAKIIANNTIYVPRFSLAQALGTIDPFWAIVVVNNCGIALASSGNSINMVGVTRQTA